MDIIKSHLDYIWELLKSHFQWGQSDDNNQTHHLPISFSNNTYAISALDTSSTNNTGGLNLIAIRYASSFDKYCRVSNNGTLRKGWYFTSNIGSCYMCIGY